MSLFNPGIPTGSVNLDQDYLNIKNNFSQLDTSFGVDHIKFSVNPVAPVLNGYHTIIHQGPQASDPAKITGIGQTYVKTVSGDTQLFFRTGGGGISQISGFSAAASGYQFIGGVILQWGTGTIPAGTNKVVPITFQVGAGAFKTSVFNIQTTLISKGGGTTSSNNTIFVIPTPTIAGFSAGINMNSSGDFTNFYWLAIGV